MRMVRKAKVETDLLRRSNRDQLHGAIFTALAGPLRGALDAIGCSFPSDYCVIQAVMV